MDVERMFKRFLKLELDKVLDNAMREFRRVSSMSLCQNVGHCSSEDFSRQTMQSDDAMDSHVIPETKLDPRPSSQRGSVSSDLIISSSFVAGEINADNGLGSFTPSEVPRVARSVWRDDDDDLQNTKSTVDMPHSIEDRGRNSSCDNTKVEALVDRASVKSHTSDTSKDEIGDSVKVLEAWLRSGSCLSYSSTSNNLHRPISLALESISESIEATGNATSRTHASMSRFMIHPNSNYAILFEFLSLFLMVSDVVTIPFQAFQRTDSFRKGVLCIKTLFWTIDMPLTCCLAYTETDGTVLYSMPLVARQYLKTRFPIDLLLVACSWIALSIRLFSDEDSMTLNDIAIAMIGIQLIRLHRLAWMWRLAEKIFINVRGEGSLIMIYMSLVVTLFVIMIHILSCVWYWISNGAGASVEDGLADRYILSVHTVLALVVGEHVSMPGSFGQRLFMVLVLLFGFIMSAAFVGSLTTAMTRLQLLARQQSTYFASLNRFLSDRAISSDLAVRINRNARQALAVHKSSMQEKDVELLELVSAPLKAELHYEIYSRHLFHHPFLRLFNVVRPRAIESICDTAVSAMHISRGDILFSAQERPEEPTMFVCKSGSLKYDPLEGMPEYVTDNAFISEAALWASWHYRGTMRAVKESHLLVLDAIRLGQILRKTDLPHAKRYAIEFVAHMNSVGNRTDIGIPSNVLRVITFNIFRNEDEHFQAPAEWGFGNKGKGNLWQRGSMGARFSIDSTLRRVSALSGATALDTVVPGPS